MAHLAEAFGGPKNLASYVKRKKVIYTIIFVEDPRLPRYPVAISPVESFFTAYCLFDPWLLLRRNETLVTKNFGEGGTKGGEGVLSEHSV